MPYAERFVQAFDVLVERKISKTRDTTEWQRDTYDLIVDFHADALDTQGYVVNPIEHAKLRAWLKEAVNDRKLIDLVRGVELTPCELARWFHARITSMIAQTHAVHVKRVASLEPCGSYSL